MSNIFHSLSRTPIAIATALFAATVTPCFAQAQVPAEIRSEAMLLLRACSADYDRLCSNVTPGGGRVLACLAQQKDKLTPACRQVVDAHSK